MALGHKLFFFSISTFPFFSSADWPVCFEVYPEFSSCAESSEVEVIIIDEKIICMLDQLRRHGKVFLYRAKDFLLIDVTFAPRSTKWILPFSSSPLSPFLILQGAWWLWQPATFEGLLYMHCTWTFKQHTSAKQTFQVSNFWYFGQYLLKHFSHSSISINIIHCYLPQGGYLFTCVCRLVCQRDYAKATEWISMKSRGKMEHRPRESPLTFWMESRKKNLTFTNIAQGVFKIFTNFLQRMHGS